MLTLKGFDSLGISDKIDLPNEFELLTNIPFLYRADLDEAYKYGGDDVRAIIDKTPLVNTRKYANIEINLQYLTPEVHSVPKLIWHVDTSAFGEENMDVAHLMITKCTAMTEFIENDLILMNFEENTPPRYVMPFVNKNQYMFTPKSIEPNRFYTFGGKHLHRCIRPEKPEFRFMVRIFESDFFQGFTYEKALKTFTKVFRDPFPLEECDPDSLTKGGTDLSEKFTSISREDGRIIINTKY